MTIKKLIEVALPLEKINEATVREKAIRHGHPSSLHMWWARRPLAAARAVIWSSLVDDPSSHPELFSTEEEQNNEREKLFKILEDLVVWENSNNEQILNKAKSEILKYNANSFPILLDPFAGGGAIPFEAQRLGLEAHAHDLNPVAVMINKAMIEIPPKFIDLPPVNPQGNMLKINTYEGTAGLAEDVKYYGNLLKEKALKKIGHLYPKVKIPKEQGNGEATVIAWIWARTVKCPNPACNCQMPLIRSLALSKKKGKEAYVKPIINGKNISYTIVLGKNYPEGTVNRTGAKCIFCGHPVGFDYIRVEAQNKRMSETLIGIIAEGPNGRIFAPPNPEHSALALLEQPIDCPDTKLPEKALGFRIQAYGMLKHKDLFTNKQLIALTTFCNLLEEIKNLIVQDGHNKGIIDDGLSLTDNGKGLIAYSESIIIYLAFLIDQIANHSSTICSWNAPNTQMRSTFARQAIPMVWDFAECNIFSESSGSFSSLHSRLCEAISSLNNKSLGFAEQVDARNDVNLANLMISTDPPYYDNIGYADLSDYFYIWLRNCLNKLYPYLFKTVLVPKTEELIATPFRFNGDSNKAREFFENGMLEACKQIYKIASNDIPVTIYYAFKQSDSETQEQEEDIDREKIISDLRSSSGWETMLSAVISAGFAITGTWPIRTEKPGRSVGIGTNALASSIVLVCRKRPTDASVCSRRNFTTELKKELKNALKKMQNSDLAPVDLAQSAIGPGIGIFSKYSKVLEADGKPMSVRSALQIINNEIDLYFNGQDEDLDKESRFCVELYTQYGFDSLKYGDAETLSKAKNASITSLTDDGILFAEKGIVHLVDRSELKWPKEINAKKSGIWLWAQLLTKELAESGIEGAGRLVGYINDSDKAEKAKSLVYRLYTIAEHKNWAKEAYAYNSLVITWPQILASSSNKVVKQQTLQF